MTVNEIVGVLKPARCLAALGWLFLFVYIDFLQFYGLEKNEEIASEWVKVRLRPSEKERLEQAAKDANQNVSEFIRAFVQGL